MPPLLTIFSAPKPFTDPHIATIQRNAIRSWLALGPEVEVLLVGDEAGMAEAAQELGAGHLPEVERNQQGTPLVSSIFSVAREAASSSLLAYINGDILTLPDFLEGARRVHSQSERFLIIGQRWDLDVTEPLDFGDGWDSRLRADLQQRGLLHAPAGSDYFIFPRNLFAGMPDFAIGRAGWDNWMIYHAREQGWDTIDATDDIQIIHQNHDYSHLPGGRPHYDLEESGRNVELAGGKGNMYTVLDANRELRGGRVRPARPTTLRLLRRAEVLLTPDGGRRAGWRWGLARRFRRERRRRTGGL